MKPGDKVYLDEDYFIYRTYAYIGLFHESVLQRVAIYYPDSQEYFEPYHSVPQHISILFKLYCKTRRIIL